MRTSTILRTLRHRTAGPIAGFNHSLDHAALGDSGGVAQRRLPRSGHSKQRGKDDETLTQEPFPRVPTNSRH